MICFHCSFMKLLDFVWCRRRLKLGRMSSWNSSGYICTYTQSRTYSRTSWSSWTSCTSRRSTWIRTLPSSGIGIFARCGVSQTIRIATNWIWAASTWVWSSSADGIWTTCRTAKNHNKKCVHSCTTTRSGRVSTHSNTGAKNPEKTL